MRRKLAFALIAAAALAACAKAPVRQTAALDPMPTAGIAATPAVLTTLPQPAPTPRPGAITGRTITVADVTDLVLNRGEVILTFDDGPRPDRTTAVLDALDAWGVKGVFFMVGHQAAAHPGMVRDVFRRGHAVGSHTYDHLDLSKLDKAAALAEIDKGERAIAKALAGIDARPAPFFRFPYLAGTGVLRASLALGNVVVFGIDVDSEDYRGATTAEVVRRTMAALDRKGGGIVLFHDTHKRTGELLPAFLAALAAGGYEVVTVRPAPAGDFEEPVQVASVPFLRAGIMAQ